MKVVGSQSDQGELRFGLYDKKETFATKDGPIVKGAHPIKSGQCEFVIPNVPYGAYAIIVGHDVNRDGKIDENPFSSELKGISNYSGKILWFPSFDKARFRLDQASRHRGDPRVLGETGRRDPYPVRPRSSLHLEAAGRRRTFDGSRPRPVAHAGR